MFNQQRLFNCCFTVLCSEKAMSNLYQSIFTHCSGGVKSPGRNPRCKMRSAPNGDPANYIKVWLPGWFLWMLDGWYMDARWMVDGWFLRMVYGWHVDFFFLDGIWMFFFLDGIWMVCGWYMDVFVFFPGWYMDARLMVFSGWYMDGRLMVFSGWFF